MLKSLKKLHKDEKGMETLQVVAILAVSAIILSVIAYFWKDIKAWYKGNAKEATDQWDGTKGNQ